MIRRSMSSRTTTVLFNMFACVTVLNTYNFMSLYRTFSKNMLSNLTSSRLDQDRFLYSCISSISGQLKLNFRCEQNLNCLHIYARFVPFRSTCLRQIALSKHTVTTHYLYLLYNKILVVFVSNI